MDNDKLKMLFKKMLEQIEEELPTAEYPDIVTKEYEIPVSGGALLKAMLFTPSVEDSFPVVLIRNPYMGQKPNPTSFREKAIAMRGYAVLNVSVRGSIDSTGEWLPFENEMKDGVEVLDWITNQSWCNGKIGTYGGSYLGHTQWSVAGSNHPALKTCFISVYGPYGYDIFYRRGMFRHGVWTGWATDMMGENRLTPGASPETHQMALKLKPMSKLGEQLQGKTCEWYNHWIYSTKHTDPYWNDGFWGEFAKVPQKVNIPIMLHGGWFDIFTRAQIKAWKSLPIKTRQKSRFVIGPWDHNDAYLESLLGKKMYPEGNALGVMQIKAAIEWFDYQLKGKNYSHKLGVTKAYNMGENRWEEWDNFPTNGDYLDYYMDAGLRELSLCKPKEDASLSYLYDPDNPAPAVAASDAAMNFAVPTLEGNPIRQRKVGERADVLSFVSAPIDNDVQLSGEIKAEIYVSSTAPATAFTVQVMTIDEQGESDLVRSDISDIRYIDEEQFEDYTPKRVVKLSLTMTDILWKIKKGMRLRVDISSANYPEYLAHPNKSEPIADVIDCIPATQKLFTGEKYPSKIILPVIK